MTRERMTELWPVMEHWRNGGEVQRMGATLDHQRNWFDDPDPVFSDPSGIWRIKPTPKLVPLEAEDWLNGGPWWLRCGEDDEAPQMITGLGPQSVVTRVDRCSYKELAFEPKWKRRSASDPEGRWQPCSKETRE